MALARIATLLAAAVLAAPAAAQQYPTKPIRYLVGFVPGGSVDILARAIGDRLGPALGQQVVIDNRGGAAGLLAAEAAAKATPDGHTLILVITNHVIVPSVQKVVPYRPIEDYAPVSYVADSPFLLLAYNGLPAKTLPEFIAHAKAQLGGVNYSTPGVGSIQHLATELLGHMGGMKFVHVAYKGGMPAMLDAISGQVALSMITPAQGLPHVRGGKIRALAITSVKRSATLPDVPTVAESGIPGFETVVWFGTLAPAATPRPVVDRLYREITRILRTPDMLERVAQLGAETVAGTPEALGKAMRADTKKWADVARQAGLKPE